ncbi:MAG: class I SAM-dependent methyltransferase [Thermoplasmata archaeon]
MWGKAYRSGLRFGGHADIAWLIESIKPGTRVLEIGCGNGKTYLALRKNGIGVLGIDISPEALEILKKNATDLGIQVMVEEGDARQLRFENGSFDAVIAIHLLDAIEAEGDRETVVSEVSRILVPDGIFLCEVFCVEDFRYGKGRKVKENTYERGGVLTTYFDEKTLRDLLSKEFSAEIWHQRHQRSYGTRCTLRAKALKKN